MSVEKFTLVCRIDFRPSRGCCKRLVSGDTMFLKLQLDTDGSGFIMVGSREATNKGLDGVIERAARVNSSY
jgi:hypothetical protein